MSEPEIISRFFHVFITVPSEDGSSRHHCNLTLGVIAQTLQEAVAQVVKQYPTAVIWTVNHRGPVHHGIGEFKEFHSEDHAKGVRW